MATKHSDFSKPESIFRREAQLTAMLTTADMEIQQLREVIALMDPDSGRMNVQAPEDAEVMALCEKWGFGAVMESAARQWFKRDPVGAIVPGPAAQTIRVTLGRPKK